MAHDKTPEATNIIILTTVLSIAFLAGIYPLLNSYFEHMVRTENQEKILGLSNDARNANDGQQRAHLHESRVPIEKAITDLGRRGRRVSPAIAPRANDQVAAVEGWSQTRDVEGAAAATAAYELAHRPPPPPPVRVVRPSPEAGLPTGTIGVPVAPRIRPIAVPGLVRRPRPQGLIPPGAQ